MMTVVCTGLRIDVEHRPREVTLSLRGELDLANVGTLRRAFAQLDPAYGSAVVVDCCHLGFIGATGIGAIAKAAGDLGLEGHPLQVVGASPFVRRLFQLSGLSFLIRDPDSPDPGRACRRMARYPLTARATPPALRRVGAPVAV